MDSCDPDHAFPLWHSAVRVESDPDLSKTPDAAGRAVKRDPVPLVFGASDLCPLQEQIGRTYQLWLQLLSQLS